jgi:hypothetical protein
MGCVRCVWKCGIHKKLPILEFWIGKICIYNMLDSFISQWIKPSVILNWAFPIRQSLSEPIHRGRVSDCIDVARLGHHSEWALQTQCILRHCGWHQTTDWWWHYDTGQQLIVSYIKLYPINPPTNGLRIWLVVEPTPLKNDGLRQLGGLFSMEKLKTFQSTNQYSIIMWRLRS